ncbi:hypothetical protein [Bacillus toyonensis]|uniref:hypothetical protein n=1 Tax=Bacillus toyonensis TaxID=155322 RepID=UPI000279AB2B|nr:hypothetical protein [Bacillus toyonensis]EJR56883.1 hypothetical protein IIO_05224 [Bacillus cereus VD115]MED3090042.1 hypothetical protein [Bacillus toyonensis]
MKNKIAMLTVTGALLSTVLVPFSDAQAAENTPKTVANQVKKIEPQIISYEAKSPFKEPDMSANPNGTLMIQDGGQKVIVNDGGFNWRWLNSYEGDNVVWNQFDKHMSSALMAGLGGSIAGILVYNFAKGVAGYISAQLIASIHRNANDNVWYTVHKLYDYDAVNVYVKYRVWVYSDPSKSRGSLIKFYEEIHRT